MTSREKAFKKAPLTSKMEEMDSASPTYEHATCHYYTAGTCRSCILLGTPPGDRIAAKERLVLSALQANGVTPAAKESIRIPSNPWGSRCKVKMSVTGTCESPIFGIVRSDLSSADLSTCPLTPPHIQKLIETLKGFVSEFRLLPYDISARTGSSSMSSSSQITTRLKV